MRKDPPLKLSLPKTKKCPACDGRGIPESLKYEMVCVGCNGAGKVNAETGEPLDSGVLTIMLRRELASLRGTNRALGRELEALYEEHGRPEPERYGPLKPFGGSLARRFD